MMIMNNSIEYDVAIVGGGIVGASLACLLANTSLRIALVDRQLFDDYAIPVTQVQPKFDARVSAITAVSRNLFDQMGLWDDIAAMRCCGYSNMHVWDADGTGSVSFSAEDVNQLELGNIVENSVILSALYKRLDSIAHVDLIAPFSIDTFHRDQGANKITLRSTEGNNLTAKLLVAADGASSKVRELAEFATKEWDYNHLALVTTVKTEIAHRNTAFQRFMTTGPLAFLPLAESASDSDQKFSSIVWSAIPEKSEELMSMSDKEFALELSASIENKLGAIEWLDKRFVFPLRQRHAKDYVQDNIVLVGDAAHSIHPLAGQGVNLGLLDVQVLVKELEQGLHAGRKVADMTVLKCYQRKRVGHNLGMMWMMEGFKHLFAEQPLPVRWFRNSGMRGVDDIPLVKNQLARRAMGIDW
jgi:2-octaprenylphenol hydroxylase